MALGVTLGELEGAVVGSIDGIAVVVGLLDGWSEKDGALEMEGSPEGINDGSSEGLLETVGANEGEADGKELGTLE